MTDPTIPEDRKDIYDALDALQRVVYDEEPEGFQVAQDTLNEVAHDDNETIWAQYAEIVLGQMEAYVNISNLVNPGDEAAAAVRGPLKKLEKAVNEAKKARAMRAHPAGKK